MLDIIREINFSHPHLLYLSIIPIIILVLSRVFSTNTLRQYCDRKMQSWAVTNTGSSNIKFKVLNVILPIIAWVLFVIALSGPRIISDKYSLKNNKQYDQAVVFVLDISKSMLAQDIYPDRISKAKIIINRVVSQAKNTKFALSVFSYNAHTVIPLTYDKNVISSTLNALQPNMLPVEGTRPIVALNHAYNLLTDSNLKYMRIVLLTDGDIQNNIQDILLKTNIEHYVIGIGTPEGGPLPAKNGGWEVFDNKSVISRLNDSRIEQLSKKINATYFKVRGEVDADIINKIIKNPLSSKLSKQKNTLIVWKQIYHWFLVAGLVLYFISTIRFKFRLQNIKMIIICGLVYFNPVVTNESYANDIDAANELYYKNNFVQAENLYRKLDGFNAVIGLANSVYRQKNYTQALSLYTKAIQFASHDHQFATALFNLANTYYILGDYKQAINLYRDVLNYQPNSVASKTNLEYAIIINEQVERALAIKIGRTGKIQVKPGSGPRSVTIAEGIDIGKSRVSLSDDENNDASEFNYEELPGIDTSLIQRGINHSKVSSTSITESKLDTQWQYDATTLDMIEILAKQEKANDYRLWKRLFEIEEGFPAPVDTPHVIKGIKPW